MDIAIFIIALSILVLVHEGGHFLAAIKTGVKVEEFGLGLPPKIFGKKIWGTIFSLNWLPIGGFCRLYGEEADGKGEEAFNNKKPWQKAVVVLGGVAMNLVLAIIIFTVVYSIMGVPEETEKVRIIGVAKGSPSEIAGLKSGDWIKEINDKLIKNNGELVSIVGENKGKEVVISVDRQGQAQDLSVLVRENPPAGEGAMGIEFSNVEMVRVPWYQFYKGIGAGFKEAYFWGKIIGDGVFKMVGGLFVGQLPKDVSGPLGMYEATSSIKKNQGILAVIHFFGVVSVNLAIVNVLPFPALDGGRMIFVAYEWVFRKRANPKVEGLVNSIGMYILLSLLLLITVSDVVRILSGRP